MPIAGLDDRDKTIITMYAQNPEVSQEEIARALKLSQPSIAARIRKLRSAGALRTQTGIDPLGMGLVMAKVDVSANNTTEILDLFRGCPYFANGYTVSGRHNLCLFFISEDMSTLEAIINGHLRSHPTVREVDFNFIISAEKAVVLPLVLDTERVKAPPCKSALQCAKCEMFRAGKCCGCPATGQYKGKLF